MSATDPPRTSDDLPNNDLHDLPDMGAAEAEVAPDRYECPHCSQEVAGAPEPLSPFWICPHCGMQFAVVVQPAATDDPAELEARQRQQAGEDELSELRIKQLSRHRRAMIRSRSHVLVGFLVCLAACAKLIQMGVRELYRVHRINFRSVGMLVFAAAAIIPAMYFLRRTRQFSSDLKKPLLQDPPTPPDFSTLQDGSQHSKNLENMR